MTSLPTTKLDGIDRTILQELRKNARILNVELSTVVHMSSNPCRERANRLEKLGYIQTYKAQLDDEPQGIGKTAFILVSLDKNADAEFCDFKNVVLHHPAITECCMVAGGVDYLVKVRFSDIQNFRMVLEQIVRFPRVSQTNTFMVIERVKADDETPLLQPTGAQS